MSVCVGDTTFLPRVTVRSHGKRSDDEYPLLAAAEGSSEAEIQRSDIADHEEDSAADSQRSFARTRSG